MNWVIKNQKIFNYSIKNKNWRKTKMKYLITGIAGFVGPHLANLLVNEGHDVIGLMHHKEKKKNVKEIMPEDVFNKVEFIKGDITSQSDMENLIKEHNFDGVFHLAAQSNIPISIKNPRMTHETNVNGTYNIVDAIANYSPKTRLLFCSTSDVYGSIPEDKGAINEDFHLKPSNPYSVSKAASDLYIRERAKSLKLNFFVVRSFSSTGPGRPENFAISSDAYQITRIKKGLQEPIIKVGDLKAKRTLMDVRDCVKAYYLLMEKAEPGEAYNVGGDNIYSIGELLDKMLDISGVKDVKKEINPDFIRSVDTPVQVCDNSKLKKVTGWEPKIPIEQTLKDLLDYCDKKV